MMSPEQPYFSRSSGDGYLSHWTDNRASWQIMGRDCAKRDLRLCQNAQPPSSWKDTAETGPGAGSLMISFSDVKGRVYVYSLAL